MCGRFVLHEVVENITEAYRVDDVRVADTAARYNIAPSQNIMTILQKNDKRYLVDLEWGMVAFWTKDLASARRPINVRIETLRERPTYRKELERRRCIIPASGFYEWLKEGEQPGPRYFRVTEGQAAFAGLWDKWQENEEAEPLRTCTIITQPAEGPISAIHDRMPALLTPEAALRWLDPTLDGASALALITPDAMPPLDIYRVSTRVNKPTVDELSLISPI